MNEEKILTDIITLNQPLISSIVRQYAHNATDYDDLMQVSRMALIRSYKNFRDDYNTKFTSYAYFYIKGEILEYLRCNKTIKSSREVGSLTRKIEKVKCILTQRLMKEPTDEEIAAYLELPVEMITQNLAMQYTTYSLDSPINEYNDGKKLSLYDNVVDYQPINTDEHLLLKETFNKLTPFEQKVIVMRYA